MTREVHNPLVEFARSLPAVLDEAALHELAVRLQPYLVDRGPVAADVSRLYTMTEAARLVSVNVETVRRAVRSGELGVAARIGRSPRLSRESIDRWLATTIEVTESGPRRRPRRRQSAQPEHSLRTTFRAR